MRNITCRQIRCRSRSLCKSSLRVWVQRERSSCQPQPAARNSAMSSRSRWFPAGAGAGLCSPVLACGLRAVPVSPLRQERGTARRAAAARWV